MLKTLVYYRPKMEIAHPLDNRKTFLYTATDMRSKPKPACYVCYKSRLIRNAHSDTNFIVSYKVGQKVRRCGHCQVATYCNRECQESDYLTHRKHCDKLYAEQIPRAFRKRVEGTLLPLWQSDDFQTRLGAYLGELSQTKRNDHIGYGLYLDVMIMARNPLDTVDQYDTAFTWTHQVGSTEPHGTNISSGGNWLFENPDRMLMRVSLCVTLPPSSIRVLVTSLMLPAGQLAFLPS